jgi:serine/threonine protein kinase
MSPEAYRKSMYSYKSEIWAVGVILYEMLLGDQPFRGIDYESLVKTIGSGEIYNTIAVTGFTKMLLSRMLSIDIERRIDIN